MRTNTASEFWTSVDRSGGINACWPWKKSKTTQGYGWAYLNGKHLAHRLAFMLSGGKATEAICHNCDNPSCCNPRHLVAANRDWNNKDRARKGRSAKTRAPK